MRLYLIRYESGRRCFLPTQRDAEIAVRQVDGAWSASDVPADKKGLLDFLNGLMAGDAGFPAEVADPQVGEPTTPPGIDAIEGAITDMDANQVARVAIAAFEQLTITGQPALDAVKGFLARQAAHGFFNNGAHVLTALALSEMATGRRIQP